MGDEEELKEVLSQMQNENACKKCGTTQNVIFEGMCKECYEKSIGASKTNDVEYVNSSDSSNVVANKFTLIVKVIKIIGYLVSIIVGILLIINISFLTGLLIGIMIAGSIWFSTLFLEAIAEIINLLQDIKNK